MKFGKLLYFEQNTSPFQLPYGPMTEAKVKRREFWTLTLKMRLNTTKQHYRAV